MSKLQTNAIRHLGSSVDNMTFDSSGRIATPNQPHAMASRNAGNVGANTVVVFNNVDSDTKGIYNSSNGRFTAPVTGRYLMCHGLFAASGYPAWLMFRINGVNVKSTYTGNTTSYNSVAGSIVLNLNASDYADLYVNGAGFSIYGNDLTQCWATFTLLG